MYVTIKVNGRGITFILYYKATNTFIANRLAKQLGLWLSNNQTMMKAVNDKAQKIIWIAYRVLLVREKWKGRHDLLVVMLDNFDVILGLDFLKKAMIVHT